MAEAIVQTVKFQTVFTATELIQGDEAAAGAKVTSNVFNAGQQSFSPTSTVPVNRYSGQEYTLDGAGEAVVDLTDLEALQDDIDATGKKVNCIRIQNPSDNSGAVTVGPAAANGYALWGAGNDLVVPIGCEISMTFNEKLSDIDAVSGVGDYRIQLAGTAADVIRVELGIG
jgi:hypothetical protein